MQTNFEYNWDTKDIKKEVYLIKEPELQNNRDRVYEAIASNGGITCRELAEQWGVPPNCISGRFTELHQQGYIVPDGKKYLPNYKGQMYPYTVWRARL